MKELRALMPHLLDTRTADISIQCSNKKTAKSHFKPFKEAIKYKFVRFGNKFHIPAISVDIDSHQDIPKVLDIIKNAGLPKPNFIVKTTKGLHIHWVLQAAIVTSNMRQTALYQKIASVLIELLGSDKHAMPKYSGRMFRNPLKHDTEYYHSDLATLQQFFVILPELDSMSDKYVMKKKTIRYKAPDFTKISEGNRNKALFDYGRHVAYKYGNVKNLRGLVLSALTMANGQMSSPVSKQELSTICNSITHFMRTRWVNKTANYKTVEFNQKLAKRQAELKKNELLRKVVSVGLISIKKLRSMSAREGGRVFGISKNTFQKHRYKIIELVKALYIVTQKPITTVELDTKPLKVLKDVVVSKIGLGVAKCNSPPVAA